MLELIYRLLDPQVGFMLLAALAAFATVVTVMMPAFSRDRITSRMKLMAVERDKMRAARLAEMHADERGGRLRNKPKSTVARIVDLLNLRSSFDTEETRDKLKMAGLRGQGPLVMFMFFRVVSPIVCAIGAFIYLFFIYREPMEPIFKLGATIAAAYLGFYLPNLFIQNRISRRQQSIGQAFPDALDLLLICVQSGMSVEAAFGKVAREVSNGSIELAEEMSLTTAELSYLQDRRVAYDNLAKRTGIPSVKAVATALTQAERYGTSIGGALRTMAKENRDLRMSAAEKKAASLPPKLTVPMILFFLPVLFVAIIGPAAIRYIRLN